jgi:tetrahydromethanopterin S-methyltransferase subunit G
MILAMPKKITIEDLARMVQEGFADFKLYVDKRFNAIESRLDAIEDRLDKVEERLDDMEVRLSRIEHSILTDHRDRIERLEERAFGK